MPKYNYQAITESGETTKGSLEADSVEAANSMLASRGLIPTRVREERSAVTAAQGKSLMDMFARVRAPELILFTKQFKTLIRAGVPMITILQVLEDQTENPKLRRILGVIHQEIREGSSLYDAFSRHHRVFSPLYCSMLRAGESSGALPEVLERLTYIIDHEHKVKTDIKSAMMYPLIVLSFLIIAFIVLLTGVIPRFVNIFQNAGLDLPLPTQICMWLYQAMANYWLILAAVVGVAAVVLYLYNRTRQGRLMRHKLLMALPVFGQLIRKAAISRFASIFAILQASGVDILDSMDILAATIGNEAFSQQLTGIQDRLKEGHGISVPLSQAKYFTPMLINMVAIGEESGNLDDMLRDVANHYDTEVEYAMKRMADAIGPILTIGLAAVVGFFALAIFLPMWDLTLMAK
jgi:type IV pilus assembly protein PilC